MNEEKTSMLEVLLAIKTLVKDAKQDVKELWSKYKFLQLQLDMLDDRLDRVEQAVGEHVDLDADFDFDSGYEEN